MSEALKDKAQRSLYETDFAVWLDYTAQLLREKRFHDVDLDHLIEEIEALSRRDKREIRSRLIVLLLHLLKYRYQPQNLSQSWLQTIAEQRRQLDLILEDSPSLKNYVSEVFMVCYLKARTDAAQETQLDIVVLPDVCPFTQAETLDSDWLP